jgi:cell division septation protein DedD
MRKSAIVPLIIATLLLISGCDWIRGQLGMPTSSELDALRKSKNTTQVQIDTQCKIPEKSVITDSTLTSIENKDSVFHQRYYIVAGSFKDQNNARKMEDILRKNGYTPVTLELKNGFLMVTAGAFSSENEARKEMNSLLEKEFSPGDLWIYDANTNKHK